MRDFIPVNFALMAHPLNWAKVLLMVIIAGLAFETAVHYLQQNKTGVADNG